MEEETIPPWEVVSPIAGSVTLTVRCAAAAAQLSATPAGWHRELGWGGEVGVRAYDAAEDEVERVGGDGAGGQQAEGLGILAEHAAHGAQAG